MENIKIFDNIFSDEDMYKMVSYLKNSYWMKLYINNFYQKHRDFPFWRMELLNTNNILFKEIKTKIEKILENKYNIERVYAVGQTYGQDGNYHTDNKENNYYTFCTYINEYDEYVEDDGYLYIKIPNQKNIIAIDVKHNRSVFFPSNYFHKGTSYLNNNLLRICITWKLKMLE